MKWIGIFMVSSMLFLVGIRESFRYKKAISFWQEMEHLATFFITELRFTCDEPLKIFARYTERAANRNFNENCDFSQALQLYLLEKHYERKQIEQESVVAFAKGLGTTDLEGQLSHCGRSQRLFASMHQKACEDYKGKGKLHQKLWMLSSAAVAVLFL